MMRRPSRSTTLYSSTASDVYKRQPVIYCIASCHRIHANPSSFLCLYHLSMPQFAWIRWHEAMQSMTGGHKKSAKSSPVYYTHLHPTIHLRISYAVSFYTTKTEKIDKETICNPVTNYLNVCSIFSE